MDKSDRKLTALFCSQNIILYCIVAVNTGFFSVLMAWHGYDNKQIGLIAAVNSASSLLIPPLMGMLCDSLCWHRQVFLLAAILAPLTYVGFLVTDALWVILVCSVLFHGVVLSIQSISCGWTAGLNSEGRRLSFPFTRSFGSLSFAVCSLALGVIVQKYGMESLPVLLAGFGVLLAVTVMLTPVPQSHTEKNTGWSTREILCELFRNKRYVLILVCNAMYAIPSAAFFTYYPVYFMSKGGTESLLGVSMFTLAVVEVPVMLLYPAMEKKWGGNRLMAVAIFGYGLKNICISMASTPIWLLLCTLLQVFGMALSIPAVQGYIADVAPAYASATAQSLFASVTGIGMLAANLLFSWMMTWTDLRSVFHFTSYFAFAATILFIVQMKRLSSGIKKGK